MKKLFYTLILSSILLIPILSAQAGLSDSFGANSALNTAANSAGYKVSSSNNLNSNLAKIIDLALSLVGTIFLALMIYGGINWMMAGGQEQKVQKATDTIRQALIGLIIVIGAYAISYYLINILKPH